MIEARQNSPVRSYESWDHYAVQDSFSLLDGVLLWLGECGFTSYAAEMHARLAALAAENPSVELAFVISITEDAEFRCPDDDSEPAQALLGENPHTREEFLPRRTPETRFGPVAVGGTVWVNITEVRYTVYMRGADGTFNFDVRDGADAGTGTLYPTIDMDAVDGMFARGVEQLKSSAIKTAEEWHAAAVADEQWGAVMSSESGTSILGQQSESAPKLDLRWNGTQMMISNAAYTTAYHRYLAWYRGIKQKCADGVSGKENDAGEEGDEDAGGSDDDEDDDDDDDDESEGEDEDEEDEDGDEDMSGEEEEDDDP
ncbi:hypothetical protein BJ138DRAFT_1184653 [Hygrophoropsis aurantiaca]|uniref:Uncharacterized protein n=1 Tax=Hygrophoropsis aurantiaca TaxID=72124 RepID=A0ACB7ZPR5_9AGAM|nr:hypothetical protein BJ138DRAFT_1184653 [Hygrophoropsis aurantiaca]